MYRVRALIERSIIYKFNTARLLKAEADSLHFSSVFISDISIRRVLYIASKGKRGLRSHDAKPVQRKII